jgi:hypothetical protein
MAEEKQMQVVAAAAAVLHYSKDQEKQMREVVAAVPVEERRDWRAELQKQELQQLREVAVPKHLWREQQVPEQQPIDCLAG